MRTMMIALVVMYASHARAQVLADGSYQMTGNAAIDVGLTAVNAINKEIAVKHEFQKFYVDSGKLDQAMEKRIDDLRAAQAKIAEERKKQLDARDDLRKGAEDRKREAGGDAKKEADLETKAKAREAELKSAA